MNENHSNFLHLNTDNRWPGFQWEGLELRPDGALQLSSLPVLDGELPAELARVEIPDGPAGVAVDSSGNIYFSVPGQHKILKVDACDATMAPLVCAGGEGEAPGNFKTPRGLLIPSHRSQLFVADSGNHRVQIFDLASGQLAGLWGRNSLAGTPQAGDGPGEFNTPWTLAADDDGNIYVVDYGNGRVQKFDGTGSVVEQFAQNVKETSPDLRPADLAVCSGATGIQIFILDEVSGRIFVFDGDGKRVQSGIDMWTPLQQPMGLAVNETAVFVGDNSARQLLQFQKARPGSLSGAAIGFSGPVAAMTFDRRGGLLVHSGSQMAPVRLTVGKGFRKTGILWSEFISAGSTKVRWHRLRAQVQRLAPEAHLRLFVETTNTPPNPAPGNSFPAEWRTDLPQDSVSDLDDVLIGGDAARFIRMGAFFSGDGRATPLLSQLRAEFDHHSALEHLPAIYRNDSSCGDFLLRFVSLFEGAFRDVEEVIAGMAKLFDPAAVGREHLPWLAAWLGLELDETWDEARQRRAIADGFARAGRRGTAEGLRESLRLAAGVDAVIEEPILNAAWWVLPGITEGAGECECRPSNEQMALGDDSVLGFTTMLAAASPQGAILGASATLDRSHLITGEDFGAPLFEDVAHQVNILVPRGQMLGERKQSLVRSVIEREKPAHVAYQLCLVEPRFRVGFQARVGVDAVVGGPAAPAQLNEGFVLNTESALGSQSQDNPKTRGRVGFITLAG